MRANRVWGESVLESLGLMLLGLAVSQSAASANSSAETQTRSPSVGNVIEEVLVTARRREEQMERVPVATTAFGSTELEMRQVGTQADLQREVPGLIVRQTLNRNQQNYSIRGQSIDAYSQSQPGVLTYIDEFQDPLVSAASFYDLASIQVLKGPQGTLFGRNTTGGAVLLTTMAPDFDGLSGTVSATVGNFGSRKLEAAVNMPLTEELAVRIAGVTERQDGYVRNRISGEDLSETEVDSIRVSLLWQPTDVVSNDFMYQYTRSGGLADALGAFSANAPGDLQPDGTPLNSTAAVFFGPMLDTLAGPGAYDALRSATPGAPPGGYLEVVEQQREVGPWDVWLNFRPEHSGRSYVLVNTTSYLASDAFELKNIIGYSYNFRRDGSDSDGSPFVGVDNVFSNKNTHFTEELHVSGAVLSGALDYIAGGYISRTDLRQEQDFTFLDVGPVANPLFGLPQSSLVKGKTVDLTQGVFAQGTYHLDGLVQGLSVTGGVRYTWEQIDFTSLGGFEGFFPPGIEESREDSEPSWHLGLEYQASDSLLLYAVHRGSWRSGGFNQSAPPLEAPASQGGNMFEPETTRDVEVGLKFRGSVLGAGVRFSMALYKQWVDDIQRVLYISLPSGLTALTTGVPGGATVQGGELALSVRPNSWVELGLSYARTDGDYGSPDSLTVFGTQFTFDTFADMAKNAGSAYVEVHFPTVGRFGNGYVRADYYAQSEQYFSNTGESSSPNTRFPSYDLVNVRAGVEDIAGTRLSAHLFVRNVANEEYFVGGISNSSLLGFNMAVPGMPRTYGLSLEYRY